MKTIADRTRQAIADVASCSIERAADDKDLANDLGLDSLDRYDLTLELEDEFSVVITDEESGHLKTVGEIVALMEHKMAVKAGSDSAIVRKQRDALLIAATDALHIAESHIRDQLEGTQGFHDALASLDSVRTIIANVKTQMATV